MCSGWRLRLQAASHYIPCPHFGGEGMLRGGATIPPSHFRQPTQVLDLRTSFVVMACKVREWCQLSKFMLVSKSGKQLQQTPGHQILNSIFKKIHFIIIYMCMSDHTCNYCSKIRPYTRIIMHMHTNQKYIYMYCRNEYTHYRNYIMF